MRRFLAVCVLAAGLFLISCGGEEEYKLVIPTPPPSNPTDSTPKPEDMLKGTHLTGQLGLADPYIFVDRTDSIYYIFGTSTAAKGFKAYKSPDLTRWVEAPGKATDAAG